MKKRIKILFLDHISLLSGGEKSLLDILINIDKEVFEPILVCPNEGPLTKEAKNIGIKTYIIPLNQNIISFNREKFNVINVITSLFSIINPIKEITKLIKAENFDVIYTNSMKAHFIGSIAAKLTNKKLIWHVRDILDKKILLIIFNVFSLYPHRLICISNAVKKQFLFTNKIRVIYNGVLPFKYQKDKYQKKLTDKFTVAIVGQIARWKGQDIFIKAAKEISKEYSNFEFIIVGDALFEEENEYKRDLIRLSNDHDNIHLTGYRSDVRSLLTKFDVLVHASIKPEPFGRVIIEAMDAAVPVIASNLGGPKEIIEHNISGILFKPEVNELKKAILRVYYDTKFRNQIAINGKKRFDEYFNIQNTISGIEKELLSLLKNKKEKYN